MMEGTLTNPPFGTPGRRPRSWGVKGNTPSRGRENTPHAGSVASRSNLFYWHRGRPVTAGISSLFGGAAASSSASATSGPSNHENGWTTSRPNTHSGAPDAATAISNATPAPPLHRNGQTAYQENNHPNENLYYYYNGNLYNYGTMEREFPRRIPSPEITNSFAVPDNAWSKQMRCYVTRESLAAVATKLGMTTECLMEAMLKVIKSPSCTIKFSKVGVGAYSAENPPVTPSHIRMARGEFMNDSPIYSPEVMKRCVFPGGINSPRTPKTPATPATKTSRFFPEVTADIKPELPRNLVDDAGQFFGKGDTFFETCCSHTHLIDDLVLPDNEGGTGWTKVPSRMVKIVVLYDIYGSLISNTGKFNIKGKWFSLNPEVVSNYEEFKLSLIKYGLRSAFSVIIQNRTDTAVPVAERWEEIVADSSVVIVLDRTFMRLKPNAMDDADAQNNMPIGTWNSIPVNKKKDRMKKWAIEGHPDDFKPSADIWGFN